MKIKWNGNAPKGFPEHQGSKGGCEAVLFQPGETKEVPKTWLSIWKDHPQVKDGLIRGSYGGFEVLGAHEKTLVELYSTVPSKEERLQARLLEAEKSAQRERARLQKEPVIKPSAAIIPGAGY